MRRPVKPALIGLVGSMLVAVCLPSVAHGQDAPGPEARLAALGLELPQPYPPFANYDRAVRAGDLLFLSGHANCERPYRTGKVGGERSVEDGYEAARLTALCLLATVRAELGSLDRVERIVRVFGVVNATDGFADHSRVMNGASDLLVEVFGDRGRHARAAIGANSLPLDLTVEIEMVVQVAP